MNNQMGLRAPPPLGKGFSGMLTFQASIKENECHGEAIPRELQLVEHNVSTRSEAGWRLLTHFTEIAIDSHSRAWSLNAVNSYCSAVSVPRTNCRDHATEL
jgi:hypothetical protein